MGFYTEYEDAIDENIRAKLDYNQQHLRITVYEMYNSCAFNNIPSNWN